MRAPAGFTPTYNPAQQRVLDALRVDDRPAMADDLATRLGSELEDRLTTALDPLDDEDDVYVGKSQLAAINGCEGRWVAQAEADFEWSVPLARGTVAHKAIGLGIHWRGEPDPVSLVDEAIARLTDGTDGLGDRLRTATEVDHAELREAATNAVTAFSELFPPLRAEWTPATDAPARAEFVDGRVVLRTKPDLTLGHPNRRGKVICDIKTGADRHHHREDLRFYALVDLLRVGVPPVRLASVYTESAAVVTEDVTEDLLLSATERLVRSVEAMVELRTEARSPELRPSPLCRWCPAIESCSVGQEFLARREEDEF